MELSSIEQMQRVAQAVFRSEADKLGWIKLGTCTQTSPLEVRVHGDTVSVPAKTAGGWTPALGPVLLFGVGGRVYATSAEAI